LESEETRRIVKQMDDLEKAVGKFFITLNWFTKEKNKQDFRRNYKCLKRF
jgi:hypothetical protein